MTYYESTNSASSLSKPFNNAEAEAMQIAPAPVETQEHEGKEHDVRLSCVDSMSLSIWEAKRTQSLCSVAPQKVLAALFQSLADEPRWKVLSPLDRAEV